MADTLKKYLDQAGLEALVAKIKSEDDAHALEAKNYADSLAKNYDAAGSAATAKSEAIADADAKFVTVNEELAKKALATDLQAEVKRAGDEEARLAGLIEGVSTKANANETAIAAINNETTGILATAKGHTDTEVAKVQGAVDGLAGKVGNVPEGSTVMSIIGEIQENAYDDTQLRADMATELDKKADKTQVATDIADAVKAEEDARKEAVAGVQGAVDGLAQTHATDKSALEGAIALKADKTALDEVSAVANAAVKQSDYDTKVAALEAEDARIAGLVEAEVTKAREEEGKLNTRLEEVEAFFKLAEGEQLDTALDTLKEIQDYVTTEGAAADKMVEDIAANKKAIDDHVATDHNFAAADTALENKLNAEIAKKADKTTVEGIDGRLQTAEGKITTVEGKVSTLEGQMTEVQGAVATKAEAKALTDAVAALEGADAGQVERIAALEAKFGEGEGNVEDMIADAKQEAIDAAAGDATTKANTAESNAKAHADGLNTAMNARVEALEAIDHDHANKAELDLIASGDKAKWDEAAGKAHEHANKTVLDGITADKVTAWDNAEQNAKTYADGLNTAMTGKVDGVDARVKTLEETIVDKAEAEDLTELAKTVAINTENISKNASAIAAFQPIPTTDIDALFTK